MSIFEEFGLTSELLIILLIDLGIATVLLTLMRYLFGWSANVNSAHELAEKDNFAFGISTAGAVAAMGIVLTGAITGEAGSSYAIEAIGLTAYGICGLILIKLGRLLHDKIALNKINKTQSILAGNKAISIVDAGAVIATAIIIRATLLWAEGMTINTFIAIISSFVVSQLMMVLLTRWREYSYTKRNQGETFQQGLQNGNTALALRHSGYLIAMGLSFNAASHFIVFSPTEYVTNIVSWLVFSIIMLLVLSVIQAIVKTVVLNKINRSLEVEKQQNIGVAAIEMAISISVAMILTALMA
ncbi:DUF350 domain-containing protein [Parashewanella spongiae]|uniref:DUF350 domain-containing protein n=1 Tax=Parashewanella spongiae TaxID=342950 RepID=A0A3A6TNN0_9GAMM|nr:DUF350 domain-containing protein [Parashewanella spongiae]MCL1078729.1 DUF350 domain-containing protein [Parashewanella spongiae]RJY17489.1 DUF350 domain-containing protein [Parashewanella spongiae]